jgi:hypothetical protein
MKSLNCFLILLGFLLSLKSYSQILADSYYSLVVVDQGAQGIIATDSINIDTLILNNDSSLKFYQNTMLVVQKAFIGNRCEINSTGSHGLNGRHPNQLNGENGQDGKSLVIIVNFKELGSLIINTSGGNGGRAANGRSGGESQNGGDGGNGGTAGNLTLIYSHEGFVPIFNNVGHNHNIQLQYFGGEPGNGGLGGRGGSGIKAPTRTEFVPGTGQKKVIVESPPVKGGSNGQPGSHGKVGKDGELILKRRD